jgi:phosphonate transport system substrate-binding protein
MRSAGTGLLRRWSANARVALSLALGVTCWCAPQTVAAESLAVVFPRSYSPLETDKLYRGYLEHLAQCSGTSLTNHFGQPLFGRLYVAETVPEAQIPALLQGNRTQMAMVSSALAVWLEAKGIAEPIAIRGRLASQEPETFQMLLLTRADSGVNNLAGLAGAKIGFPNSKPVAGPSALPMDEQGIPVLDEMLAVGALTGAGLAAGKDYKAEYPGGNERAVVGLQTGFWQAAFIAGDQFDRMVKKREARVRDFRVLWRSPALPTESIVVGKGLPAALKAGIARCTLSHRFTADQARLFEGSDTFLPAPAALYEPYRRLLPPNAAR